MKANKLRDLVINALDELKGINLVCLEVSEMTDLCDYMIVVSGNSQRQVKALAENVVNRCREKRVRPLGIEGETPGDWVLIDLADVVVHVMLPRTREFYDLERLWGKMGSEEKSGS